MAEKFYSGRDGKLLLDRSADDASTGLVEQLKVRNWSMQSDLSLLDITTLGDNHKDYTPGIVGYTGSATLLYYQDASNHIQVSNWLRDAGVGTQSDGVGTEEKVELDLRLYDGNDYKSIVFKAYITGASIGVTVGDIISADFNFTVCGKPSTVTI